MRRAVASVVIVAFAGLLCTSVLAVFSGSKLSREYAPNHILDYNYLVIG